MKRIKNPVFYVGDLPLLLHHLHLLPMGLAPDIPSKTIESSPNMHLMGQQSLLLQLLERMIIQMNHLNTCNCDS